MDFKIGEVVSIRHFSEKDLLQGIISEAKYDIVSVKLNSNPHNLILSLGDPVVLGFESSNMIYISSCNILDFSTDLSNIKLKTDSIETLANKRLFERFPVSSNATVHIGSSKTDYTAIVKNISFNGLLACSKHDFPLYQELKLEFVMGAPITLKTVIIRKSKEAHHFEYGMKIVYTDPQTPTILKRFLTQLKREQLVQLAPATNQ